MEIKELHVNSLKGIVDLSGIQCDFWAENCAVALEEREKTQGVTLKVDGDVPLEFKLFWISPQNTKGYKEKRDWLKYGAVALSCFIVKEATDYGVIEEAPQGTGFDYWLGYGEDNPNFDPDNFYCARLEVSGIQVESKQNTVKQRTNRKKRQTTVSDYLEIPAYVSIVEFDTPKAFFAKTA